MGRSTAALALIDKAIALDPFSRVPARNRIRILTDGRKADAALVAYDAWNKAYPTNQIDLAYRLRALLMLGRPQDALADVQAEARADGRPLWVALAEAALGNRKASDTALAAWLALRGWESPYRIASVRAAQGEADLAFAQLDRALVERDRYLASLLIEEAFDGLRQDPRYAAFKRRLGFPPL
jgi:predicted Zn-dependent protease